MVVGVVVAFVVAYATIAWLLRFVASNTLLPFVWYRVALGVVLAGVLAGGVHQRDLTAPTTHERPAPAGEPAVRRRYSQPERLNAR